MPSSISQNDFDSICDFAKKRDKAGLFQFLERRNLSVDLQINATTPAGLLAQQGNIAAAEFLIGRFGANLHWVAEGYQTGGYASEADKLTRCGAVLNILTRNELDTIWIHAIQGEVENVKRRLTEENKHDALWGFSASGYVEEATALIARGAEPDHAVVASAIGGHHTAVETLLTQYPHLLDDAVLGYMSGLHFRYAAQLWQRGASIQDAVAGLMMADYLKNEIIALRTLVFFPNSEFRTAVIAELTKRTLTFDLQALLAQADRLQHLMNKHDFSYNEALTWNQPKAKTWFLQTNPVWSSAISAAIKQFPPLTANEARNLFSYAQDKKRNQRIKHFSFTAQPSKTNEQPIYPPALRV